MDGSRIRKEKVADSKYQDRCERDRAVAYSLEFPARGEVRLLLSHQFVNKCIACFMPFYGLIGSSLIVLEDTSSAASQNSS